MSLDSWRVLLLGGSSGTGKTGLALGLGRTLGVPVLLADDVRLALQRVTISAEHPALHFFLTHPDVWRQPPEVACAALVAVGRVVSRALEAIVAHHVALAEVGRLIVEGDGILPELAARHRFAEVPAPAGAVRAAFLVEPDVDALLAGICSRGRGFDRFSPSEQECYARASWQYGQRLGREAAARAIPVMAPRPWETLAERVLGLL